MSGKVLAGRYELLSKKGDGGMAVVYKAKDLYLNRYVAIKILKPEFIKDSKFVDNFRKESQAAAKLSHPNIVSVYDVGKEGNIYFIVMELLDGDSLSDVIEKQAPLSEKRVIEITRQIASGLSAAHKKNIIHRDIKPHNILMTEDGVPKIADFGIAKAVNQGTMMVQSSSIVMGSVHYLSPEQAKGMSVDARSDIYSLGIVMYEMLTGTVPYDGENAVSVAVMHVNNEVPAPSEKNIYISSHMDEVVRKATRRTPAERFINADELIRALEGAPVERTRLASSNTKMYGAAAVSGAAAAAAKKAPAPLSGRKRTPGQYDPAVKSRKNSNPPDSVSNGMDELSGSEKAGRKKKKKEKSGKKGNKGVAALAIVLALVCALGISLGVISLINHRSAKAEITYVPNVLGMTEEEAADELEKAELDYRVNQEAVPSTEYEAGLVTLTDPASGEEIRKGGIVVLTLSSGIAVETVEAPDLLEMELAAAKSKLKENDLESGEIVYEYSDTIKEGYVIRQSPEAGTEVEKGTVFVLTVSKGPEKRNVKVPDLLGKTQEQAKAALEEVGLMLGKVTESESDKPEGTVISQGISEGVSIETGQSVSIVISIGTHEPEEPDPEKEKEADKESTVNYTVDLEKAVNDSVEVRVVLTRSDNSVVTVYDERHSKSEGSLIIPITEKGKGTVSVYLDTVKTQSNPINFNAGKVY